MIEDLNLIQELELRSSDSLFGEKPIALVEFQARMSIKLYNLQQFE
ncbi:hypothetical protein [Nostoc sp.]